MKRQYIVIEYSIYGDKKPIGIYDNYEDALFVRNRLEDLFAMRNDPSKPSYAIYEASFKPINI